MGAFLLLLLLGSSVQIAAAGEEYQFITKWGIGGAAGLFDNPNAIAVDSAGNIYVADRNRVQKFASDGNLITRWGGRGDADGQFLSEVLAEITVDGAGNVYVIDSDRVQKFTTNGSLSAKWGVNGSAPGQFFNPEGIAIDNTGNVFVADTGNNRVQKFAPDGTLITAWGTKGDGDGQFDEPCTIAVDGSGNVYVGDRWNRRVEKFTSNGTFVIKWRTDTIHVTAWNRPEQIVLDSAGNVYVIGTSDPPVQKFLPDGTFDSVTGIPGGAVTIDAAGNVFVAGGDDSVCKYALDGTIDASWAPTALWDGRFSALGGIDVDSSGNVYVADTYNNRIQKFASDGTFITTWGSAGSIYYPDNGKFDEPGDVAVDASGNVYVADTGIHRIQKFTSDGTFITKWATNISSDEQFSRPVAIAVDNSGTVYVLDWWYNRVVRFDSSGGYLGQWSLVDPYSSGFSGGIAVDNVGNVYVAYPLNRLNQYSSNGTFIKELTTIEQGVQQFSDIMAIACDGSGNLYVGIFGWSLGTDNCIQKYSPTEKFLGSFGTSGSGDGQFLPSDIALDSAGNVYVADGGNGRVQKFAPGPATPGVIQLPGGSGTPTDTNGDGKFDDVNGNGRRDFADIVLFFNQMSWVTAHEPVALFDFNGNSRIDFADIVWLFTHL